MASLQCAKEKISHQDMSVDNQKKMLEMFKLLFPQYKLSGDTEYMYYITGRSDHGLLSIHWFEFCILYLPKAIGEWIGISGNVILDDWLCGDRKQHIIDYLYDIFKKHQ